MKKEKIIRKLPVLLLILALYAFAIFVKNAYILRVSVYVCIYANLACSLNLISGVTGQVSMGHAAFCGIGAYTSALLAVNLGLPWWLCVILAAVTAAAAGVLMGIPALRLQGGYLVICTVGFNELVRLLLLNWTSLTRGPMGITNIPRPSFFGIQIHTGSQYLILAITLLLATYLFLHRIVQSKYGRNLRAIKEDEIAAETMGIRVHREKVIAFTIASGLAGIAGSLLAHYMVYIAPSLFIGDNSTTYLSMVVLGGMGNLVGSILAALVLTVLPELLREFENYRMLIYGLLLIVLMLGKTKNWAVTPIGRKFIQLKKTVLEKLSIRRNEV